MGTELDRASFCGGSDIAAILGLSPWKTAVQLWDEKRNPRPDTDSPAKARGRRWEAVVDEMLVDALTAQGHSVEVLPSGVRHVDGEHDWMRAEVDRALRLDLEEGLTNVEIKTVHPFKAREWGESASDDLPTHYTAQAMWGLGVTGRQRCIVAALFGADELRTYTVERDDDVIAWMRGEAIKFWDLVQTGVPPQPVALVDLDVLHPREGSAPALFADAELTRQLMRMRALEHEIKAREAEWDVLEFEIKRAMGECETLVIGSEGKPAAVWKSRAHTHLDQQRLKAEHPALHKALTVKSESRVFTLKPFSIEGVMP